MTTPTPPRPVEPDPLPGLDLAPPTVGDIEAGVRRTIAQLAAERRIVEADSGKLALALAMAEVVERKRASGRGMSTVGMDARVLLDILNDLAGADSEVDGDLAAAMSQWAEAIEGGTDVRTSD